MAYVYRGTKKDDEPLEQLPPLAPHTPRKPAVKKYATEEERRAAKAETRRRWSERNKERERAQHKYPRTDARRASEAAYRERNRERIRQRDREYRERKRQQRGMAA